MTSVPYRLTQADADVINARRPANFVPSKVSAGDVFLRDDNGLIHIPTIILETVDDPIMQPAGDFIEDLEPAA